MPPKTFEGAARYSAAHTADLLRLPLSSDERDGLRRAQLAAAHAVVAHFWSSTSPALVVMPTGSGKTAVMILASILLRPMRVLVVAPSRLLREQIVEKFGDLAPLREVGALALDATCPNVVEVTERITDSDAWEQLREADVVVALPHSASPGMEGIPPPPPNLFDLVLVDEAHHVPASIYRSLAEAFPSSKRVYFTATPFRRDQREVPGDLVFTYHLAQARADGVFGQLKFLPVGVGVLDSPRQRDEAIARAAARQVEQDRTNGFAHRLLVRASSRERADELLEIYRGTTSLKLQRVHSGLSQKWIRGVIASLRSGELDGVIAVDMLGEGFDLPNLKVAALHARHRSLAVTLQFIGRFARTSKEPDIGTATFFAIPDEIEGDAEGLYLPGAEWNEIVETLSREQIDGEAASRDFVKTFERPAATGSSAEAHPAVDELSDDDARRLIRTLRPYFHVKAYDALAVPDLDAHLETPQGLAPLLVRRSAKHHALIWIGREQYPAPWSIHEGWIDVRHEMFILVHVPEHSLLMVCSSRRETSVYDALVSSVLGDQYRRLTTSEVNRVLHNVQAPEFFSLGMRNRAGTGGGGAESYRMLAGRAADKAVRAADGAVYDQGHGFCRGQEEGRPITIGFSSGSKLWANKRDGIDVFVGWMRAIAKKLRKTGPLTTGSGIDNLRAARRIDTFAHEVIWGDLPHIAYLRSEARVIDDEAQHWLIDLSVRIDSQTRTTVNFSLVGGEFDLGFKLTLGHTPLIEARTEAGSRARLCSDAEPNGEMPLLSFLNEHPPALYLQDLARVDGDEQHDAPGRSDQAPITSQIAPIDWQQLGVDPFSEKPPAVAGQVSLFEFVEEQLTSSSVPVVFLDDGAGEIADYVAIQKLDERVSVRMFHCKAAKKGASVPNQQIASLYEVVGQAIKCRRYTEPRRLLTQLLHRQTLPGCKFVRGNVATARDLLADPSKVTFEITIVQPALSTEPSEPIRLLLDAADAYMRGADQQPLRFWGTKASG